MKRGDRNKLFEPRWERLFDQSDLEVQLVPGTMPDMTSGRLLGVTSVQLDRQVCTDAFTDFKNYTEDDGTPVKNTLEARLELFGTPVVKRAIINALETLNAELIVGEGNGASG